MALSVALAGALAGCESMQRKFTRKPKGPRAKPSPVINFQDYTRAMTPLDRYRKHYLMFEYWNGELLRSLEANPINPKRYKRSSADALDELVTLRSTLLEERAALLDPFIEERRRLHRQLEAEQVGLGTTSTIIRTLEAQTRQIQREFFWRNVQDHLAPWPTPAETPDAAGAPAPDETDATAP